LAITPKKESTNSRRAERKKKEKKPQGKGKEAFMTLQGKKRR